MVKDLFNHNLKGFIERYYREVLDGDRAQVMAFIERAVMICRVELTTLIVPGKNDGEDEMHALSGGVSQMKVSRKK